MSEKRPYVDTVEQHGWQLYDISTLELQAQSWEELEAHGPIDHVEVGGMYVFAPQAQRGQTLREAYAVTNGIGPCLAIHDPKLPDYKVLRLKFSPRYAFFTRIALDAAGVTLFTPRIKGQAYDFVTLDPTTAPATFERDFRVMSPNDFQKELDYADKEWRTKG